MAITLTCPSSCPTTAFPSTPLRHSFKSLFSAAGGKSACWALAPRPGKALPSGPSLLPPKLESVPKRLRLSPNPFSPGLSISRCRVPNTLPRYHYCTITYQIPPVYYHYRLVSAIINDSSTAAQGRLLTERVWRLWTAWLFPWSLDSFYFS